MDNLRVFKHSGAELADGCSLEIGFPLGNNFQVGAEMAFSHKDGASIEVSTNVNNISGNPTRMPDDMKQASFKYGSDESAKLAGVFKLPFGIQCQN